MHLIANPNGKDGGIWITFINSAGEVTSYWSSPPKSIDHVDIGYLRGRYWNVRTKRHVEFIKQEYKRKVAAAKAVYESE